MPMFFSFHVFPLVFYRIGSDLAFHFFLHAEDFLFFVEYMTRNTTANMKKHRVLGRNTHHLINGASHSFFYTIKKKDVPDKI